MKKTLPFLILVSVFSVRADAGIRGIDVRRVYDDHHLIISIFDDEQTGTRCYVASENVGFTISPAISCVPKITINQGPRPR